MHSYAANRGRVNDVTRRRLIGLAAVFAMVSPAWPAAQPPALVRAQTVQGLVDGESLGEVAAFRGIPYAEPPMGGNRFLPPQPPASWPGVRSALDMGPACPQLIDDDPTENNDAVMSEDCLTLNVWTPRVDTAKRPVMLWIHGGAFVVGSSRNTWYDGSHLAARGDVVVVSINYRLGAWGFLALSSFGDAYAKSANAGLLDQVAALEWVRQNIARFGGDPDNVTLFGESAGAASVGALLSMPAANGLFAKAILESGVPSDRPPEAFQRSARLAAEFLKLARVRTPADLARRSMQDLLKAQEHLFSLHSDLGTFVPSVDGQVLKERPFAVVAQGRGSRVPLMIGTTLEEMRYFSTAEDIGIERKPRKLLLSQLEASVGDRAPAVLDVYQRLYPNWGDTVVQIASDALLRFPSIRLAEAAAAHQPVYMYLFTYRSNSTYKNFGSAHAMELPFVFGLVNAPETIVFTGRDPRRYELADQIMDSWTAFARSGNPSLHAGPEWPPYDAVTRSTMELGTPLRVVQDPLSEQRKIWGANAPAVDVAWRLLQVNE
jgi:para-nitrobenzyl esterase